MDRYIKTAHFDQKWRFSNEILEGSIKSADVKRA